MQLLRGVLILSLSVVAVPPAVPEAPALLSTLLLLEVEMALLVREQAAHLPVMVAVMAVMDLYPVAVAAGLADMLVMGALVVVIITLGLLVLVGLAVEAVEVASLVAPV
jgi:hypothetical protein